MTWEDKKCSWEILSFDNMCEWEKNFNSWAMNFQLPLLDIAEFEDCVMLFGLPTNKFWSSFWCKECRLLPLNSLEEQDTQCLYLTIWVHEAKSSPFLSHAFQKYNTRAVIEN